jgi:hypothetical protein
MGARRARRGGHWSRQWFRIDGPEDPRAKVSGAVEPQLSTLPPMRHCEEVELDLSADQLDGSTPRSITF